MFEVTHCYRCIYSWRPRRLPVKTCPRCKSRLWNTPRIRAKSAHPTGQGIEEVVRPKVRSIHRLARRFGVVALRVFGSVSRGEATAASDVDVMFESRRPLGLLRRAEFREALEEVLCRRVDLVREENLKWYIRPQAVADAVEIWRGPRRAPGTDRGHS